jgi:type IV secretory pathway TrbD component
MDELQRSTKDTISVEAEWKRVEQWLAGRDDAAWGMAVIEAFKIFHQVLNEVSFGETVEERIHNAGELFRDIRGVLAAEKVYRHILGEVGHRVTKSDAARASSAFLQAILDMIGRDWQERGSLDRALSGLNYFWGTHPRLLTGILAGILVLVALIWFLADTDLGRWLTDLLVGFAHFVLGSPGLLIALGVALVLSMLAGLAFVDRRYRR